MNGNGTITPATGQYEEGSNVTVRATAATGSRFTGFSGDLTGTTNPQTIIMNGDKNVVAHFEPITYLLTVTIVGNGSVTMTPPGTVFNQSFTTNVQHGSEISLHATPAEDNYFTGWSQDGEGLGNPLTLVITEPTAITATFNPFTFWQSSRTACLPEPSAKATAAQLYSAELQKQAVALATLKLDPENEAAFTAFMDSFERVLPSMSDKGFDRLSTLVTMSSDITVSDLELFFSEEQKFIAAQTTKSAPAPWEVPCDAGSSGCQTYTVHLQSGANVMDLTLQAGDAPVPYFLDYIEVRSVLPRADLANKDAVIDRLLGRTTQVTPVDSNHDAVIDAADIIANSGSTSDDHVVVRVEAENPDETSWLGMGIGNHPELHGFSGSGYLNDEDAIDLGRGIWAFINVPYAGEYTVTVRYANLTHQDTSRSLFVWNPNQNGEMENWRYVGHVCMPSTYQHRLKVDVEGQGIVRVNPPGGQYVASQVINLEAVPADGWRFVGWQRDLSGSNPHESLTMSVNRHVVARFERIPNASVGDIWGLF